MRNSNAKVGTKQIRLDASIKNAMLFAKGSSA
jgi:hypothetical protein